MPVPREIKTGINSSSFRDRRYPPYSSFLLGTPDGGLRGKRCPESQGGCGELLLPRRDICPRCGTVTVRMLQEVIYQAEQEQT